MQRESKTDKAKAVSELHASRASGGSGSACRDNTIRTNDEVAAPLGVVRLLIEQVVRKSDVAFEVLDHGARAAARGKLRDEKEPS